MAGSLLISRATVKHTAQTRQTGALLNGRGIPRHLGWHYRIRGSLGAPRPCPAEVPPPVRGPPAHEAVGLADSPMPRRPPPGPPPPAGGPLRDSRPASPAVRRALPAGRSPPHGGPPPAPDRRPRAALPPPRATPRRRAPVGAAPP